MKFITTVQNATYPDGSVGGVYAYVNAEEDVAVALTIKRAQEMQAEGVEYIPTGKHPADFEIWHAPDFNPPGVPSSVRQVPFD